MTIYWGKDVFTIYHFIMALIRGGLPITCTTGFFTTATYSNHNLNQCSLFHKPAVSQYRQRHKVDHRYHPHEHRVASIHCQQSLQDSSTPVTLKAQNFGLVTLSKSHMEQ